MKIINSTQNENIKYFTKLNDKSFRKQEHKFLIEGKHLVEEALKTNLVEIVLSTDSSYLNNLKNVDKYLVSEAIIKKISNTKNPQNVVAVVKMFDNSINILKQELRNKASSLVMFDDINDPGNLGTLIRTAAALGYNGIVLSNSSVDIYNDKTIRASQGSIFKIKIVYTNINSYINTLKENNYTLIGTSLKDAIPLENLKKTNKFVLCLGNEANGISDEVLDLMDTSIKLTMYNDVESLNVMIAGSIIMYELKK